MRIINFKNIVFLVLINFHTLVFANVDPNAWKEVIFRAIVLNQVDHIQAFISDFKHENVFFWYAIENHIYCADFKRQHPQILKTPNEALNLLEDCIGEIVQEHLKKKKNEERQ